MDKYESKIKPPKKPLILLVDHNPSNLRSLGNILKNRNYDIAVAQDGMSAIKTANNIKPDLVLLDLVLPDIDGYEVCEKLTTDSATKDIPIIFLSSEYDSENIIQGLQLGAVDFIRKDDREAELLARINTHLKLKRYTEQLEKSNLKLIELINELNKLNEEKDEFLGIAAHDLQNPINNIALIAKILAKDDKLDSEDIKGFANDILISSERILELIKNLLDINKIERGELVLKPTRINVTEILRYIINGYIEKARIKNIKIQMIIPNENYYIFSDYNALIQILDNLISNAIKYSPQNKSITVKLSQLKENIKIEIKDKGPGFTEDDKQSLFKKFARLSAQPTGGENSTGLGLSIVKRLADAINVKVNLQSSYGKGAVFTVILKKLK